MASGRTTTSELADSLDTIVASARIIQDFEGAMQQLVDKDRLDENSSLSWKEVAFEKLTAQNVNEDTELDNPQALSDSAITVTPTVVAIHTVITDRVRARLSKKALGQIGPLAQNAMERKKDIDGLTVLDSFTSTNPGAGNTLTSGNLRSFASVVRTGDNTEPSRPPYRIVLHSYQIKDIEDELAGVVGSFPIEDGLTARVFKEGFRGMVGGAQIYEDDNITIDASADAKGAVFAQRAILLIQGRGPRAITIRNEKLGGGADELIMYDEYAYGVRLNAWGYEVYSDATEPTS